MDIQTQRILFGAAGGGEDITYWWATLTGGYPEGISTAAEDKDGNTFFTLEGAGTFINSSGTGCGVVVKIDKDGNPVYDKLLLESSYNTMGRPRGAVPLNDPNDNIFMGLRRGVPAALAYRLGNNQYMGGYEMGSAGGVMEPFFTWGIGGKGFVTGRLQAGGTNYRNVYAKYNTSTLTYESLWGISGLNSSLSIPTNDDKLVLYGELSSYVSYHALVDPITDTFIRGGRVDCGQGLSDEGGAGVDDAGNAYIMVNGPYSNTGYYASVLYKISPSNTQVWSKQIVSTAFTMSYPRMAVDKYGTCHIFCGTGNANYAGFYYTKIDTNGTVRQRLKITQGAVATGSSPGRPIVINDNLYMSWGGLTAPGLMLKLPVNKDVTGSWGGLSFSNSSLIDVYDNVPSIWNPAQVPSWISTNFSLVDVSYYFSGSYFIPAPNLSDSPLTVTPNIIDL